MPPVRACRLQEISRFTPYPAPKSGHMGSTHDSTNPARANVVASKTIVKTPRSLPSTPNSLPSTLNSLPSTLNSLPSTLNSPHIIPSLSPKRPSTPEEYFASLKSIHNQAVRRTPNGPLVIQVKPLLNTRFFQMERIGRPKFLLTKAIFSCFFDLLVSEAREIMKIQDKTMRRIRSWCGVNRWPRNVILSNTHPVLNIPEVKRQRLSLMGWSVTHDPFCYEMLYHAHKKAGCGMEGLPPPRFADTVADLTTHEDVKSHSHPDGVKSLSHPEMDLSDLSEEAKQFTMPCSEVQAQLVSHFLNGQAKKSPSNAEAKEFLSNAEAKEFLSNAEAKEFLSNAEAKEFLSNAEARKSSMPLVRHMLERPASPVFPDCSDPEPEYFEAPFSGTGQQQSSEPKGPDPFSSVVYPPLPDFDKELADYMGGWTSDEEEHPGWDLERAPTPTLSEALGYINK
jgi:hypothetical protein